MSDTSTKTEQQRLFVRWKPKHADREINVDLAISTIAGALVKAVQYGYRVDDLDTAIAEMCSDEDGNHSTFESAAWSMLSSEGRNKVRTLAEVHIAQLPPKQWTAIESLTIRLGHDLDDSYSTRESVANALRKLADEIERIPACGPGSGRKHHGCVNVSKIAGLRWTAEMEAGA